MLPGEDAKCFLAGPGLEAPAFRFGASLLPVPLETASSAGAPARMSASPDSALRLIDSAKRSVEGTGHQERSIRGTWDQRGRHDKRIGADFCQGILRLEQPRAGVLLQSRPPTRNGVEAQRWGSCLGGLDGARGIGKGSLDRTIHFAGILLPPSG